MTICSSPGRINDVSQALMHESPQPQVELLDAVGVRARPVGALVREVQVGRGVDRVLLQRHTGVRQCSKPRISLTERKTPHELIGTECQRRFAHRLTKVSTSSTMKWQHVTSAWRPVTKSTFFLPTCK